MSDRVLVIGAGLSGLAATERLLLAGLRVVVVDAFPVPGGKTASFEVSQPVAGLTTGDIAEHGLHAWFQHYQALFELMARAGIDAPPLAGDGIYFWSRERGHFSVAGAPRRWLFGVLDLPESLRGPRGPLLAAFARLVFEWRHMFVDPTRLDRESAASVFGRMSVPEQAVEHFFRPCLFSLTSLPLEQLSALEMFRWMSHILPDARIRSLPGGGTKAMCAPITAYLRELGADFRFGVEVERLEIGADRRVRVSLVQARDRSGVRHVLVPGFEPAALPDPGAFDAIVCTLPWERLLHVCRADPAWLRLPALSGLLRLENVHPLAIRLWFERPIAGAEEHYILASGSMIDVLRPTPEPLRHAGIRLIDGLVENLENEPPGLVFEGERLLGDRALSDSIVERALEDLEAMYPGQIRKNRLLRRFLHTREGIVACRPNVWNQRPAQDIGLSDFVIGGEWTQQPFGICMEGAVRSGQLAAEALLGTRDRNVWTAAVERGRAALEQLLARG